MPPRSYVITAIVLAVLVVVSFPLTMGFSIILWYWLFLAAACILAVLGAFRLVHGLGAPRWIGVALALPGFVWAANSLLNLTSYAPTSVVWIFVPGAAAHLAFLAAAVGALRLAETMSGPHPAYRIGYGLLAASALLVGIFMIAHLAGLSFTRNALYATPARILRIAANIVAYGAFIGAAILVMLQRDIERWTGAAISLIGVYMLYQTIAPMFAVGLRGDTTFWLLPVILLIGGAAVWRMGSVLNAPAVSMRYAQS